MLKEGSEVYAGYDIDFDNYQDLRIPQFLLDEPHIALMMDTNGNLKFHPREDSRNLKERTILCDPFEYILNLSDEIISNAMNQDPSPPFGVLSQKKIPMLCFECCVLKQFLTQVKSVGPFQKTRMLLNMDLGQSSGCTCNHLLKQTLMIIARAIQKSINTPPPDQ